MKTLKLDPFDYPNALAELELDYCNANSEMRDVIAELASAYCIETLTPFPPWLNCHYGGFVGLCNEIAADVKQMFDNGNKYGALRIADNLRQHIEFPIFEWVADHSRRCRKEYGGDATSLGHCILGSSGKRGENVHTNYEKDIRNEVIRALGELLQTEFRIPSKSKTKFNKYRFNKGSDYSLCKAIREALSEINNVLPITIVGEDMIQKILLEKKPADPYTIDLVRWIFGGAIVHPDEYHSKRKSLKNLT